MKEVVLKIDLSKAYDQVNWTYIRVILSQMGFVVSFISWVMGSLFSVCLPFLLIVLLPPFLDLVVVFNKASL